MNFSVVDIFATIAESLIIINVLINLLTPKNNNTFFKVMCLTATLISTLSVTIINMKFSYIENSIYVFGLIISLFCFAFFKDSILNKIGILTLCCLALVITDILVIQTAAILFNLPFKEIALYPTSRTAMIFISKGLLFLISRIIVFLNKKKNYKFNKNWMIRFIVPILSLYILLTLSYIPLNFAMNQEMNMFFNISMIFIVILNIMTYYYTSLIEAKNGLLNKNNLMINQRNLEIRHYKEMNTVRHIYHDLKSHMLYINQQLKNENYDLVKEYVEKMTDDISNISFSYRTGNHAIDTIIGYKLASAVEEGINVKVYGASPDSLSITDYDLCCILSNILDNAIEACEQVKTNDKNIVLNFCGFQDYLKIDIKNSANINSSCDVKELKTTKLDTNIHGIGLESVKRTLDKNDGFLHLESGDGFFVTSIMIKMI